MDEPLPFPSAAAAGPAPPAVRARPRRGRTERLSLPILISFNELAWIVVFALGVLYAGEAGRTRRARAEGERQVAALAAERDRALAALAARDGRESTVRRELLGLKGPMRTVAFVVDRSASMAREGRWQHVQDIVRTWLEHLRVERAVLITFADRPDVFPQSRELWRLDGPEGDANRAAMVRYFHNWQPDGNTNTLAALEQAYQFQDVDTILLFTDGVPDSGQGFDGAMSARIFALIEAQRARGRAVPVNAIGLGNYFDPRFADFLMRLSGRTGGSYLGL